MANDKVVPSLSESGWVNTSAEICDALMSHFFLAEFSQTYIYPGMVSSLPYLLQNNQGNMTALTQATQSTLATYFGRYFSNVVVEVNEVDNVENPSQGAISIYVTFTDSSGAAFNLGKLLQLNDTKIQKIITLNNG